MIKRAAEKHDYWIGLKLDLKASKFHTTSGLPPTYKKWNAGEPNNIPSKDCVMFKDIFKAKMIWYKMRKNKRSKN